MSLLGDGPEYAAPERPSPPICSDPTKSWKTGIALPVRPANSEIQRAAFETGRIGGHRSAYIAGPMRGIKGFNFPSFFAAERLLNEAGFLTINPARMDRACPLQNLEDVAAVDKPEVLRGYVARDLAAIQSLDFTKGDALVVIEGWDVSAGASAEVAVAKWLKLPVWTVREAVQAWGGRTGAYDGLGFAYFDADFTSRLRKYEGEAREAARSKCVTGGLGALVTNVAGPLKPLTEADVVRAAEEVFKARPTMTESQMQAAAEDSVRLAGYEKGPAGAAQAKEGLLQVAERAFQKGPEGGAARAELSRRAQAAELMAGVGERRVVSATGGEKGDKLQRYDLIPDGFSRLVNERTNDRIDDEEYPVVSEIEEALRHFWSGECGVTPLVEAARLCESAMGGRVAAQLHVATVYGAGARKYSPDNWKKGYAWSLNFAAALRHLAAIERGEMTDQETQVPHYANVWWHCATLWWFNANGVGTDDRPGGE